VLSALFNNLFGLEMKLFLSTIIFIFVLGGSAMAAPIIRDAEIESVLRDITDPIFKAANLSPNSITVYIASDTAINAYVAGGNNMFINTGLLEISENPNIITGVIAHETGHISGGHLIKSSDEYSNTTLKSALGYMVGLAAAAAGSPKAGMAIVSGTGQIAERQLLKYTRTHEESADQAALGYLDKTHQSAKGLLELLQLLNSKETSLYGDINQYTQTHPLSKERISHVQNHIKTSSYSNAIDPPEKVDTYARAITKLNAFLQPYDKTLKKYPQSDQSINARYARAIAYYKIPDIKKSLQEIDGLIALQPQNPFFHELKGQVLFENGKVKESIPHYSKAVELLPNSSLLKVILATAQISSENDALLPSAIKGLEQALKKEKQNSFAWHQLAIAYGRSNDLGMSNLALAEESALIGAKRDTKKFLNIAQKNVKPGSHADLRIKDMLATIDK
jgi:predicted Zn-dependent protease